MTSSAWRGLPTNMILGIEFRENRVRGINDFQSRKDWGFGAKDCSLLHRSL